MEDSRNVPGPGIWSKRVGSHNITAHPGKPSLPMNPKLKQEQDQGQGDDQTKAIAPVIAIGVETPLSNPGEKKQEYRRERERQHQRERKGKRKSPHEPAALRRYRARTLSFHESRGDAGDVLRGAQAAVRMAREHAKLYNER